MSLTAQTLQAGMFTFYIYLYSQWCRKENNKPRHSFHTAKNKYNAVFEPLDSSILTPDMLSHSLTDFDFLSGCQ